jgi:hypothetical protein
MIEVTSLADEDPMAFEVVVREPGGTTTHHVTLAAADLARLSQGRPPKQVIEAAFRFLLDREPKEAILARFDISAISGYFPEFGRELPNYLSQR